MDGLNLKEALINILEASTTIERVIRHLNENATHLNKSEREAIHVLKGVLASLDQYAHAVEYSIKLLNKGCEAPF
jgi:light-regulated signal transduction histidine kinase (bacteriophytochrome)